MPIELFDTHCHTHEMVERTTPVYDKWNSDGVQRTPESIIGAAHEVGVSRMLCVGTTLADSELAVKFVTGREGLWASIGIHPHEASSHNTAAIKQRFRKLLEDGPLGHKIIAVGECGLDYFYNHSPREAQVDILRFQIDLALEYDLPISFHVRGASSSEPDKDAFSDFWPIFESYGAGKIRGVLHSFTDSQENLERALKHGLLIGVNGIATFAKTAERSVIYRTIPQQALLLETDAPFLTPVPFRGKVCESKHVRVTAEFLADLRGQTLADLAAATTANARTLFKV